MEDKLWNDLPGVVATLKIMSDKIYYLQKQNVTMSDAFGVWLELGFRLKSMNDCQFAVIMLEKLIHRRAEMNIVENDVMLSAMFLDLRFNRLLNSTQREKAIKHLQYLHQKLDRKKNSPLNVSPPKQKTVPETDHVLEQILRELEPIQEIARATVPNTTNNLFQEELRGFCEIERANAATNVIAEWEARKFQFPILYELAQTVMSVSPTQASVERNFSTLEFVLSKRRNRLADEHLETILFIKLNKNIFYEAFEDGEFTFD